MVLIHPPLFSPSFRFRGHATAIFSISSACIPTYYLVLLLLLPTNFHLSIPYCALFCFGIQSRRRQYQLVFYKKYSIAARSSKSLLMGT